MSKDFSQLTEQIRQARLKRGLSQENMAESLGISTSAYGDIERGKTEISIRRLIVLAELLEVSVAELLSISESNSAEVEALKATIDKLVKMNLELAFKNEVLERRLSNLAEEERNRRRIGF